MEPWPNLHSSSPADNLHLAGRSGSGVLWLRPNRLPPRIPSSRRLNRGHPPQRSSAPSAIGLCQGKWDKPPRK
jgi:hypothetical protein